MKRRAVLAAAGTGLIGGCLAETGTVSLGASSGPASDERRVTLVDVDDVPEKHAVTIDAELLEETVTPDHTARLRVTTTNEGEQRTVSISEGRCNLFNRQKGASEPSGLWLHRPESEKWMERRGDRWTLKRDADEYRRYLLYGCAPRCYDAGESLSNDYHVWDDYRDGGYMTPSTYRFEESVELYRSLGDHEHGEKLGEFAWGFDLRVEVR